MPNNVCFISSNPNHSLLRKKSEILATSITSKIAQFSHFTGPNDLIRASGRTKQISVATFDVKHPVFLDGRHSMVQLLLEYLHKHQCHQEVDYLRALVQHRITLRTIVSRSVTCRKRRAETLTPMMSDLHSERLAFKEPLFSNTGIEYFGPFFVSVKRSTEKRWGLLFTCLTTGPSTSRWSRASTRVTV